MRELVFDGSQAYEYMSHLCLNVGPRHGGSESEIKASKYIRDIFDNFGLKSSLFPYEIYTFDNAISSLSFPDIGNINCVAVPCCESTSNKGVESDLVFLESPDEVFLDSTMKGKIIMTVGDFRGKNYEALMRIKPAGVIQIGSMFINPSRGRVNPETRRKFGSIPTVKITYEDGLRIISSMPKKCKLKVQTFGEKVGKAYNVIGEIDGIKKPDEIIVIGGHFDSVWGSQGCQDNAAGMAIVMELARVFSNKDTNRTLRFIGFSGEELGLRGSTAYIKKLKKDDEVCKKNKDFVRDGFKTELDKILFMVNIDVQGTKIGSNSCFTCGPSDIAASVRLLAAEIGTKYNVSENNIYSSDNAPFGYVGIPSASFGRSGVSSIFGHTDFDIIHHCDNKSLSKSGRFIEEWILRYITNSKSFPFERKIPGASQENVKKYFKNREIFEWEPQMPTKKYKAGMSC
jgi:Iap family predicted aminopeptidase